MKASCSAGMTIKFNQVYDHCVAFHSPSVADLTQASHMTENEEESKILKVETSEEEIS